MFDYLVYDPSIQCVMSENGKHWLLTVHEPPEMISCAGCVHDVPGGDSKDICLMCFRNAPDRYSRDEEC